MNTPAPSSDEPADRLGICQWFHYEDRESVERCLEYMGELGLRRLRTGISWADYLRPGGRAWYDWQMRQFRDVDVLLSVWHTPPSLGEAPACNAPPRRLQDYADFIDLVITEYGDCFDELELWNEPNNRLKWNFRAHDPQWEKFAAMITMAANWAKTRGVPTVLGGMIPVDPHWMRLMKGYGLLPYLDVVAIHGFPGMWWADAPNWDWHAHWRGWEEKVAKIEAEVDGRPVWITETGLATVDLTSKRAALFEAQVRRLEEAAAAPAGRVYWYSMIDLDPAREAIEGFHVDENEYHMGLVTWAGERKPAFHRMGELLAGAPVALRDGE